MASAILAIFNNMACCD